MKRIVITVSPARFMRWQQKLRDTLAKRWPEAHVAFHLENAEDHQPGSITALLGLERLLLQHGRPALCDRLTPSLQHVWDGVDADVVIDLTGLADTPRARRTLRPLYDGHDTDQAAMHAILSGAPPVLAVEDVATGEILAEGLPAFECETALTPCLDAVYSRMAILIEQAIASPRGVGARPSRAERRPPTPQGFLLKTMAQRAARAIYRLCCHSPHWRIGWRHNDGPGLLEAGSLDGPAWNALYNSDLGFAADPFPVQWGGQLGVFFEALEYREGKGTIKYQALDRNGPVGEPVACLVEPWHLSYPFLIEHNGELFMLPEASLSGAVTLYRCVRFPDRWEPVSRLLDNIEAADATIFQHGGRYWMTSVIREGFGGYSDTLAIHHAPSLFGPWRPHALSPTKVDARYARPAGAVVTHNGALVRPAQDCSKGYGQGIALMRIDVLDEERFEQSLIRTVYPEKAWPGRRLHTINRVGSFEFIDGTIFAPKYLPLRRIWAKLADANGQTPSLSSLPALLPDAFAGSVTPDSGRERRRA